MSCRCLFTATVRRGEGSRGCLPGDWWEVTGHITRPALATVASLPTVEVSHFGIQRQPLISRSHALRVCQFASQRSRVVTSILIRTMFTRYLPVRHESGHGPDTADLACRDQLQLHQRDLERTD